MYPYFVVSLYSTRWYMALDHSDPDFLAYKKAKKPERRRYYADKLLRANMPLVTQLVRKYSRYAPPEAEQDDLMQAGMIAFIRTLEKFDLDRGRKFATLLGHWVRFEVSKVVDKLPTIYRPRGSGMPYRTMRKQEAFQAQHGREP